MESFPAKRLKMSGPELYEENSSTVQVILINILWPMLYTVFVHM